MICHVHPPFVFPNWGNGPSIPQLLKSETRHYRLPLSFASSSSPSPVNSTSKFSLKPAHFSPSPVPHREQNHLSPAHFQPPPNGPLFFPMFAYPTVHTAARVLLQNYKMEHVTPLLKTLQWFPLALGIKSRTLTKTHRALPVKGPSLHLLPPTATEEFQSLPAPRILHILLSPFDYSFPNSSHSRCLLTLQATSSQATPLLWTVPSQRTGTVSVSPGEG